MDMIVKVVSSSVSDDSIEKDIEGEVENIGMNVLLLF